MLRFPVVAAQWSGVRPSLFPLFSELIDQIETESAHIVFLVEEGGILGQKGAD